MKKILTLSILMTFFTMYSNAQKFNDLINLKRYATENSNLNEPLKGKKVVVFLGNSITEGWVNIRPDFFKSNNFIGRGISGQTSPQLLSRFRRDVIDLHPTAVVINIGTNDVAENTGDFDPDFTLGNIISMVELAKANKIKVILSAILPADGFQWSPEIKNSVAKIDTLNKEIESYAKANKIPYVDYNTRLRNDRGGLKESYGNDGVHPNDECYQVMESIVLEVLKKAKVIKK